jgi:hypothetical protein
MIEFVEDTTKGYRSRTQKNASADVTIAFAVNFNSAGEILTKSSVLKQGKTYIPIDTNDLTITDELIDMIVSKLNRSGFVDIISNQRHITLNIAGNGIYTMKGKWTQNQVDDYVYEVLKRVISKFDGKIISLRTGGQTGFDEAGAKAGLKLGIRTLVLAPLGWKFRDLSGKDIMSEKLFKKRFQ